MRFLMTTFLALAASTSWAAAPTEAERPPDLNCDVGPLHKTYGKTAWLVYACNDSRSVVIVSDKGNPALPFYFILYVNPDGDMQLHGEGTGKKSATQAAFDEIKTLTQTDVAGLVAQAQAVQAGGTAK
ncbi:hypothetical protein ACFPN1_16035 [Lysobacter yangpyeongensis]|uniref:Uncharacterized protein n=1 Tax=Lysobacter yangpyeongensis TaxID=346182 RepID=A0ABW0SR47_9GAMM